MHSHYQQNVLLQNKENKHDVLSAVLSWTGALHNNEPKLNISIESFKLSLNEIKKNENKNSFIIILIIISKDAFLSKGASTEETASQDQQFHLCDTDSENISLLVNNSNISLLFPADTFMVMFAGALWQALTYCVHLNTELFSCAEVTCARCCFGTLNTVEPLSVAAARSRVVSISAAIFFITNWWCLKYKNKEKPKKGLRPGPRLNYDVKIGPKPGPRDVKKSGPEMQGSNTHIRHVTLHCAKLRIWTVNSKYFN